MPPKFSRGESESDDESEYDAGSEYDGDESDDSSDTTPIKRARLSSSSTQFETSGFFMNLHKCQSKPYFPIIVYSLLYIFRLRDRAFNTEGDPVHGYRGRDKCSSSTNGFE